MARSREGSLNGLRGPLHPAMEVETPEVKAPEETPEEAPEAAQVDLLDSVKVTTEVKEAPPLHMDRVPNQVPNHISAEIWNPLEAHLRAAMDHHMEAPPQKLGSVVDQAQMTPTPTP